MSIVFAIILGVLFGFVLQRVGAADPDKIIGMLTLKDLHLMKAILGGIGVASALLFLSLSLGLVESSHVSVKTLHWGVALGGVFLGGGWALSGFCPGTGVVAAGSGRKDSLFFILGGLLGAGMFTLLFEAIDQSVVFTKLFGGDASIVYTGNSAPMIAGAWSMYLAVAIGIGFILVAYLLPQTDDKS